MMDSYLELVIAISERDKLDEDIRKLKKKVHDKEYHVRSFTNCHAAHNQRNDCWYVRSLDSSIVGKQLYLITLPKLEDYDEEILAERIAKNFDAILSYIAKR